MPPNLLLRRFAEAVPPAQVFHRDAGIRFAQKTYDLLFRISLLHIQSPSSWGLDSKSACYSKPGGRRGSNGGERQTLAPHRKLLFSSK